MSLWDDLSKDYRVMLWAAFVILALIFVATPLPGYVGLNHGLKYGLDLEGGSWLQLQLQGAMVQLDVDPEKILEVQFNASSVEHQGNNYIITTKEPVPAALLDDLGYMGARGEGTTKITLPATPEGVIINFLQKRLDTDVKIVPEKYPIQYEIRTNVTRESLNQLLAPMGGRVPEGEETFVEGVTAATVDQTKSVLDAKLNRLGLQDIKVRIVDNKFILIDLAGKNVDEAQEVVGKPGKFEIRIQTKDNESMHVLYGDAIESVDVPTPGRQDNWGVPFTLSEEGARAFQKAAIDAGATKNPQAHQISMILDKEPVFTAPLSDDLASSLQKAPTRNMEATVGSGDEGARKAKALEIHLRAGALPVNVKIVGSGQVAAALGAQFKFQMVIAAIIALLAVMGMIYYRYREKRIALPMAATSFSEVIMMLGIWSAMGWQMDLASLAGIIMVLGTGVDHLVIITDELLRGGEAVATTAARSIKERAASVAEKAAEKAAGEKATGPSGKVYLARLSRAFSIILGAALTTVFAMVPLLFMGFGALTGFALIIVIGVLIGVGIARPAYGRVIGYIMAGS